MPERAATETTVHRALAEPRRAAIVEELEQAGEALDATELARRVGRHPNTVRWHLDTLLDAGLIRSHTAPRSTPGRPRVVYELTPGFGQDDAHHRLLAAALADAVARSENPGAEAERAGRALGRQLAESDSPAGREDPVTALVGILADHGFEPVASDLDISMHRCPYGELARTSPAVVCGVHRGLVAGALDELGSTLEIDELEVFPRPDVCIVHLRESSAGR